MARRRRRSTSRNRQGQVSGFKQWAKRPWVRVSAVSGAFVVLVVALALVALSEPSSNDFEFTMYQGEDVLQVSELKYSNIFPAEKPVVLNFWAGLCPVCIVDMPIFQEVYDEFQEDFIFLALDIGPFVRLGSHQDARNLLQRLNITYPAGYVHNRDAMVRFGITGTPSTVFLTPDGKVFKTSPGYLERDTMAGIIQDLVEASASPA